MLKKSKTYIAVLLAVVMALATILPAMASAPGGSGPLTSNDKDNPVRASIAKKLDMPIGTITPTARFTFHAVAMEHNTGDGLGPTLGPWHVDFSSANVADETKAENGLVSVVLETVNIFDGVTFPAAGIYKYEITEQDKTNQPIDDDDNQRLDYSTAKYIIYVYVENAGNETFVAGLGTFVEEVDNDNQVKGEKVDPTPDGGNEHDHSQIVFTNTYVKLNPPTDPVVNPTLAVEKQVIGNLANKEHYFSFDIKVDLSPLLLETMRGDYFRAYIVDLAENEVVTNIGENATAGLINAEANPPYIKVVPGETVDFKLKHNQRLAFVDTPVGANYVVEEKAAIDYIPGVVVLSNNVETLNRTLEAKNQVLNTGTQLVGVEKNSAVFTNTREDVPPAGLLLANLPFIMLILLGTLGLGFIVAMKARRKEA